MAKAKRRKKGKRGAGEKDRVLEASRSGRIRDRMSGQAPMQDRKDAEGAPEPAMTSRERGRARRKEREREEEKDERAGVRE